jgi:hypothetical protein
MLKRKPLPGKCVGDGTDWEGGMVAPRGSLDRARRPA